MTYRPITPSSTLALLLLVSAGCGQEPPASDAPEFSDEERLVVSNPGPDAADAEWRLVEDLRIGRVDGAGPEVFGQVAAVEIDPDGRIYVAEGRPHQIRVFDADGRHLRTIGSEGRGPGQFSLISGLAWHSGFLWVMDPLNRRLTVFGEGVDPRATHPRDMGLNVTIPWAGRVDSLGRLHDVETEAGPRGTARKFRVRYRMDPDEGLRVLDSLRIPDIEVPTHVFRREGVTEVSAYPFSPRVQTAVAPDGGIWLANTAEYRLHKLDYRGDTMRTVGLRQPSPPVTAEERDSAAAATGLEPDRIPDVKPAIRYFDVGDDGRLWVQPVRERGAPAVWDVFEDDGAYVGRVRNAPSFEIGPARPAVGDGVVVGVVRGALGVPYVVRARLERGERE